MSHQRSTTPEEGRYTSSAWDERAFAEEKPLVAVGDEEDPLLRKSTDSILNGAPVATAMTPKGPRQLTLLGLVAMTFFCVSGGPYGIEDAVRAGYPFFFLIGMITIPWIWSLPCALMTAELSTAMPESGGFILWVKAAFGPFMAFQEAWWSFVNNMFDLAIYPVMFSNYLDELLPKGTIPWWGSMLIRFGVLLTCALLNLFGVKAVSRSSGIFIILILLPFVIMVGMGMRFIKPIDWLAIPPTGLHGIQWGLWLTTIAWSTGGFDNMSQVAGDLENPTKSYPRAMIITLVAMILVVIFPVMVGVCAVTDYSKWTEGYFAVVAQAVGGEWLRIWIVLGACLSSLGILNTYLCTCSEMLAAWGEKDLLGISFLQHQSPWGTPWVALLINTIIISGGTFLKFDFLVQIDQLMYALGLTLEYLSLIWLRFSKPNMPRPYKIPLNDYLLVVFCLIPIGFCIFTIVSPLMSSLSIVYITVTAILLGFILYPICVYSPILWRRYVLRKPESSDLDSTTIQ
jgi:amino acid transporter